MPACPPAPGTPPSATSATPPTLPGSRTAPGTGCCTATPSRSTVTPPTLATRTPPGGWPSCWLERGDLEELRARADAGDEVAAVRLAGLLAERGDLDEAAQILRAPADAGDEIAAVRLAGLLAERGDLDGLRAPADAGDEIAAVRLAGLLAERGDLDEAARSCAPRPTRATRTPPVRLAELLAERGDLDGLRARADADDWRAASRLVDLLRRQGRGEEAERLRRYGLNPDGSIACA